MKIVCMAVMMLAAATEAHVFSTAKLQWMQSVSLFLQITIKLINTCYSFINFLFDF